MLFQLRFASNYFMKNTWAEQKQFRSVFSENRLQVQPKTKAILPFLLFFFFLPIYLYLPSTRRHVQLGSSLSPYYESFNFPYACSITYTSQLCILAQMASFELLWEDHLQQTLKLLTWRLTEISLNLSCKCSLQLLLFPIPQNYFISYTNC